MPLIVISGLPASGKSTRAKELKDFFIERNKKVHLISENEAIPKAGFQKNFYFADSQKEKQIRSDLKSDAIRMLSKENVVILDAGNYIKGYRYELFCATKAARSTQITVFTAIQKGRAWEFNEQRTANDDIIQTTMPAAVVEAQEEQNDQKTLVLNNSNVPYTREIFDALCMRYEEPHGNCRWDSPLIVVFPDDKLDLENIYKALFEAKPLPPNLSTQNPPLSTTNYLFELDRLTQEIVADILAAHKIGIHGPVPIKNSQTKVDIPTNMNAIQLNRIRRQFLNYSKLHHATSSNLERIPSLFVQFLNSNCS